MIEDSAIAFYVGLALMYNPDYNRKDGLLNMILLFAGQSSVLMRVLVTG